MSTQRERVVEMEAAGHDTKSGRTLLGTMERTLVEWRKHQQKIIAPIAQIEAGLT